MNVCRQRMELVVSAGAINSVGGNGMKLNFRKRAEDIEVTESRPEPSRRRGTFKMKTVVRSEVEPGSDQAPPQSPKETDEVITNSPSEKPKARLTADVSHETYVKIKNI